MNKPDIVALVAEYGAANIRFFITEEENQGFFRNPRGGRREYVITERRYQVEKNYKIGLTLAEPIKSDVMPEWFESIMNEKSYYICDLESLLANPQSDVEMFVLVDADDKYQRLA